MSKFKFKLAPIVSWKSALISQEERELEALRNEFRVLTEQIQALDTERQSTETTLLSQPCTTGSSLSSFARYRLACHAAGVALCARANDLKLRIEAQTARLTSTRRERELMERLKDRQSEAWRVDNNRKMDSEAGDSFLVRWNRERPARSKVP
jgi:flagellar export protein FliJ